VAAFCVEPSRSYRARRGRSAADDAETGLAGGNRNVRRISVSNWSTDEADIVTSINPVRRAAAG
jgi:hypothetical protein